MRNLHSRACIPAAGGFRASAELACKMRLVTTSAAYWNNVQCLGELADVAAAAVKHATSEHCLQHGALWEDGLQNAALTAQFRSNPDTSEQLRYRSSH